MIRLTLDEFKEEMREVSKQEDVGLKIICDPQRQEDYDIVAEGGSIENLISPNKVVSDNLPMWFKPEHIETALSWYELVSFSQNSTLFVLSNNFERLRQILVKARNIRVDGELLRIEMGRPSSYLSLAYVTLSKVMREVGTDEGFSFTIYAEGPSHNYIWKMVFPSELGDMR